MELSVIQNMIYEIRGMRIMLDKDLAELYGVETKQLKRAVNRNIERFPEPFMFQVTEHELHDLRCQIGTSSQHGGNRYTPYAFTEEGVAMLSAILHSPTAIQVSINIMRAFVAMRNYILSTKTLNAEINELKAKMSLLEKNDEDNLEAINDLSEDIRKEIDSIYQAIGALSTKLSPAIKPRTKIGFKTSYGE